MDDDSEKANVGTNCRERSVKLRSKIFKNLEFIFFPRMKGRSNAKVHESVQKKKFDEGVTGGDLVKKG